MTSRKKAGFIAGAGIGAAAAVALRRRWSGGGDGAEAKQAPSPTTPEARGRAFLDHLAAAVRIPTVSHEDSDLIDFDRFAEFRAFLASTYPLTHSRLEREVVAGHSLLFTWPGSDPDADALILMAHQDVVPVEAATEEAWEQPPFSGAEDGPYLYGRGTLDDKGSLVAILEAVEGLLAEDHHPGRTIHLVFGHDEEVGGTGAGAVAALLEERGVHASAVLDEGGAVAVDFFPGVDVPIGLIGIGEKGYVNVQLTAHGSGGHSSAPPASTAIGRIAAAVRAIERNPMPARVTAQKRLFATLAGFMSGARARVLRRADLFGPVLDRQLSGMPATNALIRTTAAATMVSGGVKPNVLPQQATALVNFRVMPGDTTEGVLRHVEQVVGDDIEVVVAPSSFSADPPPLADPESAAFVTLAEIIAKRFPVAAVAPWILTGATDSRHFVELADHVLRFAPFTASADDFSRFHGTGERIRVSDADAAVGFYRSVIHRLGGSV